MFSSHVVGRRWFALALVAAAALAAGGCQLPVDDSSSPSNFAANLVAGRMHTEQREQLAADLARLDQICWFMIITRSQSTVTSTASIVCKAKTGSVSDASAFAQGKTISDVVAQALLQLEEQIPSAKLLTPKSEQVSRLQSAAAKMEQLALRSWEYQLDKNSGWTAVVKVRREDELFSRSVRADHPALENVVHDVLEQLMRSEAPLRQ